MTEIIGEGPRQARREWRLTGIIFFGILALAILWTAVMILRPFITAILLGAIIVTVSFPQYRWVRLRMKGRQNPAAIVMLIGITLLVVLPMVIVGILLVQQANTVVQNVQSGEAQQVMNRLDLASRLDFLRRWIPGFDPATINPQRLLLPVLQQLPGWVARHGTALVGGLAGIVLGFFLVLLSAYFFYVEGEAILTELAILSPLPARYDQEFGERFKDVIDATFRGQVMTSLAQGIATTVGLAIAGVPAPLFWGAVATLLSLLPMVGVAAVWVPASIYLFVTASMGQRGYFGAIFLTLWGLLVVSTIDNVIRPWVMKGKAQLPAIPLLFAVLGGLQTFGFVGLVIGPLVFSLLMSVVDIYKRSFRIPRTKGSVA
jgi:predicted PurR-regulated permease PerM